MKTTDLNARDLGKTTLKLILTESVCFERPYGLRRSATTCV